MKAKVISAAALAILFVSTLIFFYPYRQVIALTYENKDSLLAYVPLKGEETFQIQYTHSIHLSDVVESYQLSNDQIIQTELSYKDFAVGMPSNAEGEEVFEEKNGTYYIKNMNRVFPFIDVRIGQVRANHRLIYENHVYALSRSVKPGTWIRISERRLTLWEQWKAAKVK
ncbi:DUF1850 domain-containing protein [Domibacillus sp. PGB-M46]|uniref:DUF1850 domain-containing protein n=1 Tax=Domibacillus sp. PGB-M46 TaxID=2910255 RepID=UPI00210562C6